MVQSLHQPKFLQAKEMLKNDVHGQDLVRRAPTPAKHPPELRGQSMTTGKREMFNPFLIHSTSPTTTTRTARATKLHQSPLSLYQQIYTVPHSTQLSAQQIHKLLSCKSLTQTPNPTASNSRDLFMPRIYPTTILPKYKQLCWE